jgi:tetratricopeptide (TPR) repeat protein
MKINLCSLILGLLLLAQGLHAQQSGDSQYLLKFQEGSRFYGEMRIYEAAAQFRGAQEISKNVNEWAQATYWVILTELALGDYGSALRDMDELDIIAPKSSFAKDMVYHRARTYYNQGYFEDALVYFKRYNDSIGSNSNEATDRKAAAFFWMGECLFSMGQLNEAEKFYSWVIVKYPNSPKIEVSGYRIDLIKQKKIEAELLSLLRWSHEESLRNSEDYQRKIRTYENTINAYQRRITELTQGDNAEELFTPDQYGESYYNVLGDNDAPLRKRAMQLENELKQIIENYDQKSGGPN